MNPDESQQPTRTENIGILEHSTGPCRGRQELSAKEVHGVYALLMAYKFRKMLSERNVTQVRSCCASTMHVHLQHDSAMGQQCQESVMERIGGMSDAA